MAMTPEEFGDLLEPILRKTFFETYDSLPEQYNKFLRVENSKKRTETDWRGAGLGMWDEHDATVEYEDYAAGDTIEYTHTTFSKGIIIPFELAEDDQYNVIGPRGQGTRATQELSKGAKYRVEVDAASILNDGFTVDGYDGEPLFDDEHPNIKGGGTQSNLLTRELSEQGLREARLLMRGQENEVGLKINAVGKRLIVPPDLEYTALKLTESDHVPGTDHNDKNVIARMIDSVVVLDHLDDEDAWFLQDPNLHQLLFLWRVKPEMFRDKDIDRFHFKFTGRMRFSYGYSDWRGMVGSTGAVAAD